MTEPGARAAADAIITALDEIVQLVIDAGVNATRDPAEFQPPGGIVAAPTITGAATMATIGLLVPVWIVSDQPGGLAGADWLLEAVSAVLPALAAAAEPTLWHSPINPSGLPAYLITARVNVSTS